MQKNCNCILEGKSVDGRRWIVNNGTQYRIGKRMGFSSKGMLISIISMGTNARKVVDISGNCNDFIVRFQ